MTGAEGLTAQLEAMQKDLNHAHARLNDHDATFKRLAESQNLSSTAEQESVRAEQRDAPQSRAQNPADLPSTGGLHVWHKIADWDRLQQERSETAELLHKTADLLGQERENYSKAAEQLRSAKQELQQISHFTSTQTRMLRADSLLDFVSQAFLALRNRAVVAENEAFMRNNQLQHIRNALQVQGCVVVQNKEAVEVVNQRAEGAEKLVAALHKDKDRCTAVHTFTTNRACAEPQRCARPANPAHSSHVTDEVELGWWASS